MSGREEKPYISDPKLVPRIKLFLKGKNADQVIVPDSVAQHLQAVYKEYSRKPKAAFNQLVSKAFRVAHVEVFGEMPSPSGTKRHRPESSSDSEPDCLVNYQVTNTMNLAMRELYKGNNNNSSKSSTPSRPDSPQTPSQSKKKKKKSTQPQSPAWTIDRRGSKTPVPRTGNIGDQRQKRNEELSGTGSATRLFERTQSVENAVTAKCVCKCRCGAGEVTENISLKPQENRNHPELSMPENLVKTLTDVTKALADFGKVISGSVSHHGKGAAQIGGKRTQTESGVSSEEDSVSRDESKQGLSVKKKKLKRKKLKESEENGKDGETPGNQQTSRKTFSEDAILPTACFADFRGYEQLKNEMMERCESFVSSEFEHEVGADPEPGLLLHGPSGSGKSLLVECMATHVGAALLKPCLTDVVGGVSGESEKNIKDIFEQAASCAPCVLLLEHVDDIASSDNSSSTHMYHRMVSVLSKCLQDLRQTREQVLVVATAVKVELVHRGVREQLQERRFGMPDEEARHAVLSKLCANKRGIPPHCDLRSLARLTPAFVAGDLNNLVQKAMRFGFQRLRRFHKERSEGLADQHGSLQNPCTLTAGQLSEEELQLLTVTEEDFQSALAIVVPAAKREGFATKPTFTWEKLGALSHAKKSCRRMLMWTNHPESAKRFKVPRNSGILLYGPPGCGKTSIAKAMANEAGLNFMCIKGPEIFDKYVGESEKRLREIFASAQTCSPCLIFLDEIESLGGDRTEKDGSHASRNITTQLLTLMDGVEGRDQVFVMGATNILEKVDPALLRSGRFDTKIFVGLPDEKGRKEILDIVTENGTSPPLAKDCNLEEFAQQAEGFSGADLQEVVNRASLSACEQFNDDSTKDVITKQLFQDALDSVRPSVLSKDIRKYKKVALQCDPNS